MADYEIIALSDKVSYSMGKEASLPLITETAKMVHPIRIVGNEYVPLHIFMPFHTSDTTPCALKTA